MNGKKKLANFYIANSLRWNGFLSMMFTTVLLAAMPMVLEVILQLPGLKYYSSAFVFFIPALFHKMLIPFIQYPGSTTTRHTRHARFCVPRDTSRPRLLVNRASLLLQALDPLLDTPGE